MQTSEPAASPFAPFETLSAHLGAILRMTPLRGGETLDIGCRGVARQGWEGSQDSGSDRERPKPNHRHHRCVCGMEDEAGSGQTEVDFAAERRHDRQRSRPWRRRFRAWGRRSRITGPDDPHMGCCWRVAPDDGRGMGQVAGRSRATQRSILPRCPVELTPQRIV